jgi:hypothetical protein
VQRAAVIGVIASAGVRMMRASVVAMAVGVVSADVTIAGLVVTGMRNRRAGGRMSLRQRRRDDAGKLGEQKEGDQEPNRARLCAEPLHDSSG